MVQITERVTTLFLLGQISASLAAMSRTIEDYDAMAKREMIKAKQEKAQMCAVTYPRAIRQSDGMDLHL